MDLVTPMYLATHLNFLSVWIGPVLGNDFDTISLISFFNLGRSRRYLFIYIVCPVHTLWRIRRTVDMMSMVSIAEHICCRTPPLLTLVQRPSFAVVQEQEFPIVLNAQSNNFFAASLKGGRTVSCSSMGAST
jgi:hypothetical protein